METAIRTIRALPDYRLEIVFQNGSMANINFKNLIRTMRFSKLKSPELFDSVRTEGDRIIWSNGNQFIQIYCNELVDLMMS